METEIPQPEATPEDEAPSEADTYDPPAELEAEPAENETVLAEDEDSENDVEPEGTEG